jgi:hypothetical protein
MCLTVPLSLAGSIKRPDSGRGSSVSEFNRLLARGPLPQADNDEDLRDLHPSSNIGTTREPVAFADENHKKATSDFFAWALPGRYDTRTLKPISAPTAAA